MGPPGARGAPWLGGVGVCMTWNHLGVSLQRRLGCSVARSVAGPSQEPQATSGLELHPGSSLVRGAFCPALRAEPRAD
eukprot:9183086-Alexandrium_andersonii.AAC.1